MLLSDIQIEKLGTRYWRLSACLNGEFDRYILYEGISKKSCLLYLKKLKYIKEVQSS